MDREEFFRRHLVVADVMHAFCKQYGLKPDFRTGYNSDYESDGHAHAEVTMKGENWGGKGEETNIRFSLFREKANSQSGATAKWRPSGILTVYFGKGAKIPDGFKAPTTNFKILSNAPPYRFDFYNC